MRHRINEPPKRRRLYRQPLDPDFESTFGWDIIIEHLDPDFESTFGWDIIIEHH